MPDFRGARVALLESRLAAEAAALVGRLGGVPISAPAVQEVARPIAALEDVLIARLNAATDPLVVCLTGAGVRTLFADADAQGCADALVRALSRATTVCRGPKPAGALATRKVPVSIRAAGPFTTREVIQALEPLDVRGRLAVLLHYGERNVPLRDHLSERDAAVLELLPYEWQLPDDTRPLDQLVDAAIAGGIDAIAFTSQVQVRHLWEIAASRGPALTAALSRHAIVGAIGPTCAAALEAVSVRPGVVPDPPRLNALLRAMADAVPPPSVERN